MNQLLETVSFINRNLSDYVLTFLLGGIGIYFTIRTRFVQIRYFAAGWKKAFGDFSFHGKTNDRGISRFQALSTAIAAQVGTGNIVGASGAILTGGPGAIFWMWLIAFFGMATSYAEAVLAIKTRVIDGNGTYHGGPAYYIKYAFPNFFGKFLAVLFAVATVISLGLMGSMVQANSIGETCAAAFDLSPWQVGIAIVLCAGAIFLGGIRRIAGVTEKMVPAMALIYLIGGLFILLCRINYLPETFGLIFKYAFIPEALLGGGFGYALKTAVSQGVKRGLFSNEAGMGSTPHAHAAANVRNPHTQGIVAMVGVFIDTAIVLTMTALIVISTVYTGDGPLAEATGTTYSELIASAGLTKTNLVQFAAAQVTTPAVGNMFIAVCLLFFAFSTILSWNYFGKINWQWLCHGKFTVAYTMLALGFIYLGTLMKNDLVWELQDMFNQLMVLPNIIALAALSKIVVSAAHLRRPFR